MQTVRLSLADDNFSTALKSAVLLYIENKLYKYFINLYLKILLIVFLYDIIKIILIKHEREWIRQ